MDVGMDLSASSRLITSALTSLEVPPHEYSSDVQDEIHCDGGKDDKEPSSAATQNVRKDQQFANSMESSMTFPSSNDSLNHLQSSHNVGGFDSGFENTDTCQSQVRENVNPAMSEENEDLKSTGDLVLAAISVMKGRKARPDTKRLCNWVHRKYGRSVQEVVDEIDRLCAGGILEKVEYKGSISFRIVSDKKLHKRAGRRKSNNNTTDCNGPKHETPKKPPGIKKSPKKKEEKSPDTSQPLTVNFIVNEQLRPGAGAVLSREEILKAIETSPRPINKKNVFRDLETILAQEIHLGYIRKIKDGEFTFSSIENSKAFRGTIALKVSKRKTKPTQKVLEMESELKGRPGGDNIENVHCSEPCQTPDLDLDLDSKCLDHKTEDQLKDDLIKEKLISNKLFKMKNKMKATKIRARKEKNLININGPHQKSCAQRLVDSCSAENVVSSVPDLSDSFEEDQRSDDLTMSKKMKRKKETWQTEQPEPRRGRKNIFIEKKRTSISNGISSQTGTKRKRRRNDESVKSSDKASDMADDEDPNSEFFPSRSGRKKRARKIFDPADHVPAARSCKKSRGGSPVEVEESPPDRRLTSRKQRGRASKSKSIDIESDVETEACLYCDQGDLKNEKLISCEECHTTVHPTCLNYPEELTDQIYVQAWQCINCKTCFICRQAGSDDTLLFCDSCDLGYHMDCLSPPLLCKPQGRWECSTCASHTGFTPTLPVNTGKLELALEQEFEAELPPLPPEIVGSAWQERGLNMVMASVSSDLLTWDHLPADDNIPDITSWSPARISQYLVQQGIQELHAKVFFDQELDGGSVLLMQRKDIVKGLGLKLGPALKIFNRIKTLQTRRKFQLF